MTAEVKFVFHGTKEAEGIALNQVGVREIGPIILVELAPGDPEVQQAEVALAQARANQFMAVVRQQKNGQILNPNFLKKPPKGKKPKKGK